MIYIWKIMTLQKRRFYFINLDFPCLLQHRNPRNQNNNVLLREKQPTSRPWFCQRISKSFKTAEHVSEISINFNYCLYHLQASLFFEYLWYDENISYEWGGDGLFSGVFLQDWCLFRDSFGIMIFFGYALYFAGHFVKKIQKSSFSLSRNSSTSHTLF